MKIKSIVYEIVESHFELYNQCDLNIKSNAKQIDDLYQWASRIDQIRQVASDYLEKDDLDEFNFQIGINSLIVIASQDIAIITKQLVVLNDKAEAVFYIKHVYLIINEFIKNYHGKEKAGKLSKIVKNNYPEYLKNFEKASKLLSEFKKDFFYEKKIIKIRNTLAGHIDDDFMLWYNTAINLDIEETVKMIFNFNNMLVSLQNVSTLLMKAQTLKIINSKKEIEGDLLVTFSKIEALNKLLPEDKMFDLSIMKELIIK